MKTAAKIRSLPGMESDWTLVYVRSVLVATGWSARRLTQEAGIAPTTLTRALNSPDHKFNLSVTTLNKLRDASGVPFPSDAAGDLVVERQERPRPAMVPVYDVAASAGHGAVVEGEAILCNMAFDQTFLRAMTDAPPGELAIIRVKGHSMEPTLLDDDHVLVDRTKRNLAYDGLFVLRFDDVLHVKRIGRSARRGHVMVTSDNTAYEKLDMAKEDLEVVGRVLWVGRKV